MTTTTLIAAVKAQGSSPIIQNIWASKIANWHLPGRFAFFVFHVQIEYIAENYFPGLELQLVEDGYIVGGTLDKWSNACYALLNTNSPHDCVMIYREVHNTLTDLGYSLRGSKTVQHDKFYLS